MQNDEDIDLTIFNLLNDYRQHRLTANSGVADAKKLIGEILDYVLVEDKRITQAATVFEIQKIRRESIGL